VPDTLAGPDAKGLDVATRPRASCRVADDAWSVEQHHRIRHQVFVDEQRLFDPTDRDEHDDDVATIKVLGLRGPEPVGAVRLYPLDARGDVWQGDRLAVLPLHRRYAAGAPLVRFAVRTAGERGGALMVAHIQVPNVPFFERLGWRCDGPVELYVGVPHQPMAITLQAPADQADQSG
jgi:putative N-acetyltransferase (TIGR04045 family)